MEINKFQHPDSIWTWRPNRRKNKVSLWLPYFQEVERLPKGKGDRYRFVYKGGEVTCHLKEIEFLMFYGASGELSLEFLDRLNEYGIPLMIHRRNMHRPFVFFPERSSDDANVLTTQILARENQTRRCYIARVLVLERLRNFAPFLSISRFTESRLKKARDIETIRSIEAQASRRYWKKWFAELGFPDLGRRNRQHPANEALNAGSFFLYGILLRWILFHKLSPCHGFMHKPTTYPALVYDLMEPYRYLIEDSVKEACSSAKEDLSNLTGITFSCMKAAFEKEVYVPATRQTVREKNLLHGVVLALRSYLIGESKRLVLPVRGRKKGGRPPKVGFRLPGAQ
jgi:CRISPR-associated endonuclease Cas1